MTVDWTYAEAVARDMTRGALVATVVVRDPLHPADIAGDIHARLARSGHDALCIHALGSLDLVSRIAVAHEACPIVVTTAVDEWEPLVDSRDWISRTGSIAFVLAESQVERLHPQVATVATTARHIFVSSIARDDPRSIELLARARTLMCGLLQSSTIPIHCADIGLDASRIHLGRALVNDVFEYLEEARRSQRLVPAFERLHRDYPRSEVSAMLREMRLLYYGS